MVTAAEQVSAVQIPHNTLESPIQVNYYIIVPTSDEYAVDLSAPASLCGAIIGATPLCALVSAFIFSRWSNRYWWLLG